MYLREIQINFAFSLDAVNKLLWSSCLVGSVRIDLVTMNGSFTFGWNTGQANLGLCQRCTNSYGDKMSGKESFPHSKRNDDTAMSIDPDGQLLVLPEKSHKRIPVALAHA